MLSNEDKEFLKTYKADDYQHPSVTVDMLIFTVVEDKLKLMLIKRKNPPYKDKWAIPGGFVEINESVDAAAVRELKEETGIKCYMEQFGVFGDVDRDPRTRVISIAYFALVPFECLKKIKAGDDAKEVKLFDIRELPELAFDHYKIIMTGWNRLREKLEYTKIAFDLLPEEFTIQDIQKVYESILGYSLDKANFRRMVKSKFELEDTGKVQKKYQRPAKIWRLK
jgi:8-oxo-dGTP diphosphatase